MRIGYSAQPSRPQPKPMPDPSQRSEDVRPLIQRLKSLLTRVPDDRAQLLELLRKTHERDLIDADAVSMIEGVLQVSELSARDIMVPRSQMDVIDISQPFEQFLEHVIATAHSRFPVVEGDRDNRSEERRVGKEGRTGWSLCHGTAGRT